MDRTALLALLLANHNEDLTRNPEGGDGAHVFQVWEDGEMTLTKAGSLYGQRGLHMIQSGHPELRANPLDFGPTAYKNSAGHSRVCIPFALEPQVVELIWGVRTEAIAAKRGY